jgi:hypothetical protein
MSTNPISAASTLRRSRLPADHHQRAVAMGLGAASWFNSYAFGPWLALAGLLVRWG